MTGKCKQRDAATFAATFCLIFIRVGFFCRPAATAVRTGRGEPHGAASPSIAGHGSKRTRSPGWPWGEPGALGGRPWQERCARTSARPQVSLGEGAAPQPHSTRWRPAAAISRPSAQRAPPGPARPCPPRSGAVPPPPRCSCFPGSARLRQVPPPPRQCGPPPSLPRP